MLRDLLLCVLRVMHTHSQTPSVHTNTLTHTPGNPVEVQRWLSALYYSTQAHFKFLMEGARGDDRCWAPAERPKALSQMVDGTDTPGSGNRSRYGRLLTNEKFQNLSCHREYELGTLLYWEHPMLGVYTHNVYLFADILDSSCNMPVGLSPFHY